MNKSEDFRTEIDFYQDTPDEFGDTAFINFFVDLQNFFVYSELNGGIGGKYVNISNKDAILSNVSILANLGHPNLMSLHYHNMNSRHVKKILEQNPQRKNFIKKDDPLYKTVFDDGPLKIGNSIVLAESNHIDQVSLSLHELLDANLKGTTIALEKTDYDAVVKNPMTLKILNQYRKIIGQTRKMVVVLSGIALGSPGNPAGLLCVGSTAESLLRSDLDAEIWIVKDAVINDVLGNPGPNFDYLESLGAKIVNMTDIPYRRVILKKYQGKEIVEIGENRDPYHQPFWQDIIQSQTA